MRADNKNTPYPWPWWQKLQTEHGQDSGGKCWPLRVIGTQQPESRGQSLSERIKKEKGSRIRRLKVARGKWTQRKSLQALRSCSCLERADWRRCFWKWRVPSLLESPTHNGWHPSQPYQALLWQSGDFFLHWYCSNISKEDFQPREIRKRGRLGKS